MNKTGLTIGHLRRKLDEASANSPLGDNTLCCLCVEGYDYGATSISDVTIEKDGDGAVCLIESDFELTKG